MYNIWIFNTKDVPHSGSPHIDNTTADFIVLVGMRADYMTILSQEKPYLVTGTKLVNMTIFYHKLEKACQSNLTQNKYSILIPNLRFIN